MNPERVYYTKLFPTDLLFKFLHRHSGRIDKYREIALRWNIDGKHTWQRFNSYSTAALMKKDVARRMPIGIYAGPIYNSDPSMRFVLTLDRLKPVEHKLIFDIDLTDYNDIRSCACVKNSESKLRCCKSCWTLAACAIIILRNLLRYKFGFHEFLFTFSGSKGAHCWVLDESAQTWQDTARLNLSEYFRPFVKEFVQAAPMQCRVLADCYAQVIEPLFEQHVVGSVVDFNTEHGRSLIATCIRAHSCPTEAMDFLRELPPIHNPSSLWTYIKAHLQTSLVNGDAVVRSVVMMCTFPRLDKDITTSMQHLIRCPFSINGARGKLCLPIRYEESLSFNPENAPDANSIDDDELGYYTKIMQEALEAPWSRLWICRVCAADNVYKCHPNLIFLSESAWQQHHEDAKHRVVFEAVDSTPKALAKLKYRRPTLQQKQAHYLHFLQIKESV